MSEKRIDPSDSIASTFAAISRYYKSKYTHKDIVLYWKNKCVPETRIDPEDGRAYTLQELILWYKHRYSTYDINRYWELCEPVTRIDPEDGRAYTLQELKSWYEHCYSTYAINRYWELCVPETRFDPEDGQAYTLQVLTSWYKHRYSTCAINRYWELCMPETRIDPKDGQAYTLQEFKSWYEHRYSTYAINRYWELTCLTVSSQGPGVAPGLERPPSGPLRQGDLVCIFTPGSHEADRVGIIKHCCSDGDLTIKFFFGHGRGVLSPDSVRRLSAGELEAAVRDGLAQLDAAASGSWDQMEAACDDAQSLGIASNRVLEGRIMAASLRLEAAAKGVSAVEMDAACDHAQSLGLASNLVQWVRDMAKALVRLSAAAKGVCAVEMEAACDHAESLGVASHLVHIVHYRAKALVRLEAAAKGVCAVEMDAACHNAESFGVASERVHIVRNRATALVRLEAAAKGMCAVEIDAACDNAESFGVASERVHIVRNRAALVRLVAAAEGVCAVEMEVACDNAESLGVASNLVHIVRNRAKALVRLEAAAEGVCAVEMEAACDHAQSLGVASERVQEIRIMAAFALMEVAAEGACAAVRKMAKILAQLEAAEARLEAAEEMEAVCSPAQSPGVANSGVREVRNKAAGLARLEAVAEGVCAVEMHAACDHAESLGVASHRVQEVRNMAKALARLEVAAASGYAEELNLVLDEVQAHFADLSQFPVQSLRQTARRLVHGEALLSKALEGQDVDEIQHACQIAKEAGVQDAMLSAACRRVQLLQSPASDHKAVHEVEEAFLVGRTENHNRLAKLMANVLTHHDAAHALPQLLHCLGGQTRIFDSVYSRVYSLNSAQYGLKGGKPYFKPTGWLRFALHVEDFCRVRNWCVAYHGTMSSNLVSILLRGLRKPGEEGVEIAHGQAYSQTNKTIYLSPSIEYAAFPVYSQLFELNEREHWGQLVLQCRVRPGAFVERPGSLGNKYWPEHLMFDPNFSSIDGLEWLVETPDDIVVTGLMMREFGPNADVGIYGPLVAQVGAGVSGPEFEWTQLRSQDFERRSLLLAC